MAQDPRTLRRLIVGGLIVAIYLAEAGRPPLASAQAYVANSGNGTVSIINTTTNTVQGAPIMVGGQPHRVAVTPDGRFVYVTNLTLNNVSVIDTQLTPPVVIKTIPLGASGRGVSISGNGFAYVVGGQNLHKIDITNNHTPVGSPLFISGTSSNGPEGVGVTPNGSRAYVTDKNANVQSLFVIDAGSTPMTMIFPDYTFQGVPPPQPASIGGSFPKDVVVRPDGLFVYNTSADQAVQVNRVSDHNYVGGCFLNGLGTTGIAAAGVGGLGNGQVIFAANSNSNTVSICPVNDTSGLPPAPATIVTVGDGATNTNLPQHLSATPNGQFLYVTNRIKHTVEVINLTSTPPAKIATIPGFSSPLGIAVSPLATPPPGPPPPPPPPSPPVLNASLAASPGTVTVGQGITVAMTVTNNGGSAASSVAASPLSLIGSGEVSRTSGPTPGPTTIGAGANQIYTYTYNATAPGTVSFSGNASGGGVSSPTATSNTVTIQLAPSPPALSVTPGGLLGFAGEQGLADPLPQSLQVANTGGGTLGWSITPATVNGGKWLSANPVSGSAPPTAAPSVAAGTCGLLAGSYTGSVAVSAAGATGSPQSVPVTLTVGQPGGLLPTPTARVCADRTSYGTGQTLVLSASLRQGASSNSGDAYLFAQVPGTTSFVSLVLSGAQLLPQFGPAPVPLGTGFQVPNFAGEVFEFLFGGSEPPGAYQIKAILALPGADPNIPSNQLAVAMSSFSFAP